MVNLPKVFIPYRQEAAALLANGAVKDVEFSASTYQIMVEEPSKESVWTFLQLNEMAEICDSFCSCEESNTQQGCAHLAAAYLKIFNKHSIPLHMRFERSIWQKLCRFYAEQIGFDSEVLEKIEGGYRFSPAAEKLFQVQGLCIEGTETLQLLIENRKRETEETSLKFSNLSQTELQLWREGRPSLKLLYQLSFWNDLAHWMMTMQDRGEYTIAFGYSQTGLPNYLTASFPTASIEFSLPTPLLITLIPSFAYVDTPIAVTDCAKDTISKIYYKEERGCFIIDRVDKDEFSKEHSIQIGEWLFSREKGFIHTDTDDLFSKDCICADDVTTLLKHHYLFIQNRLVDTEIHPESIDLSYQLHFDATWNLHIQPFLFTIGDLQQKNSRIFGSWAYLAKRGFYRICGAHLGANEVISANEVSNFVTQNRVWLSTQRGFSPHLANIESKLSYSVDGQGNLYFELMESETEGQKDFGRWIYIVGRGFFSKVASVGDLSIRPGSVVRSEAVGLFIHTNQEQLQTVYHFFSSPCPVVNMQVHVDLVDSHIRVSPIVNLEPGTERASVKFYGDYVFMRGEGFSLLPAAAQLPEEYRSVIYIEKKQIEHFLSYELSRLTPYIFSLDPKLRRAKQINFLVEWADLQRKGLYRLCVSIETELGTLPLAEVWKALQKKEKYLFSPAGLIELEQSRFSWIRSLDSASVDPTRNMITLPTFELIRLGIFEEMKITEKEDEEAAHTRHLLHELIGFKEPENPDSSGLTSALRPYQQVGLKWLWFLYHHNLSGLLCDDMGLGKTHQSMALMAAMRSDFAKRKTTPKFLVICPTSVLHHWKDKLNQFLPGIRICLYYGLDRSLESFSKESDLLLTSYGIWRREVKCLKNILFDLAIFDEVQIAKSQSTRLHFSLTQAQATMRVGLTGTPIENRLLELRALFEVVLPTFMPQESEFRELFVKPIEKQGDEKRKMLLSRLVKPFILRRKKEDVLTDLPEKIEEVAYCLLSNEQHELYSSVLHQECSLLVKELSDESKVIPYVHIFAILTHLKRICDHPAVYLKDPSNYQKYQSGKWDLFVELLSEARNSKQKIVVFTQYLAMLDIFEKFLTEKGICFASVRGSTVHRDMQLRAFNEDPSCEVFLGSLQAVGMGVDLTAGSVVIHYDRWWNAARENQATDRVHRIGQTRGVQVFKLVTKGTFEERIDLLISRKGKLMEDIVGVDDQDVVKRLDRHELIELLQYVDSASNN